MAAVAENGISADDQFHHHRSSSPAPSSVSDSTKSEFQRDVRELVDLLSKLNPSAKEFFPSTYSSPDRQFSSENLSFPPPFFSLNGVRNKDSANDNRRKRNNFNQGRRRLNGRALRAQREDSVRRTVYVSDIDQHVTEEHLASLFINCGQVVDCRVCGDPHSVLRFAFVEFADEQGARAALNLGGTMLGYYPVRVLPSKTAILPVNPTFLPRSEDEREMCARTVYCTNIDKEHLFYWVSTDPASLVFYTGHASRVNTKLAKMSGSHTYTGHMVTQNDVKVFFESICGEVSRLRLLGDQVHSTRIAFVEFVMAESAIVALSCSGMVLGTLPVRVSPSKTPVRPRVPRAMLH